MKAKQLREMSVDELKKDFKELTDSLYKLRFQSAAGQMENPSKVHTIRRDIARILTVLKEKSHVAE
jgi:large subunit ribosomal protein L29